MNWTIDGIEVRSATGSEVPTFTRGDEVDIEFIVSGQSNAQTDVHTVVLGGPDGTTLSGTATGTLSSAYESDAEVHRQLKSYIEYDGSVPIQKSLGGNIYVREYLTDDADPESYIVPVESDVPQVDEMWAAITGGENTETVPGLKTITLNFLVLAKRSEYDTRQALLDDISSPVTQL